MRCLLYLLVLKLLAGVVVLVVLATIQSAQPGQVQEASVNRQPAEVAADQGPDCDIETVLLFDSGARTLEPHHRDDLDQLATRLEACEFQQVKVVGFSDPIGDSESNLKLSGNRAAIVADYLIENGIDEHLIATKAGGELDPLQAPGSQGADYGSSRRVEISTPPAGT